MGSTMSFASSADISADVIIRVDLKDGRMRITTSIQKYEMEKGKGVLGALQEAFRKKTTRDTTRFASRRQDFNNSKI